MSSSRKASELMKAPSARMYTTTRGFHDRIQQRGTLVESLQQVQRDYLVFASGRRL